MPAPGWPSTEAELRQLQQALAREAASLAGSARWSPEVRIRVGGCFVAYAQPRYGPGGAGDPGWAAAVVWTPPRPGSTGAAPSRRGDQALRGATGTPRRALDLDDQVVVAGYAAGAYVGGLLALRSGPILAEVVCRLRVLPDVLLVDGTGVDHPRRAGLAVHLGAVTKLPTVGVTHRPLLAHGGFPPSVRGAKSPLLLDGDLVGYWVCTRQGARPVAVHAGWRTDAETAVDVVLSASTNAARTPVPLQEARRVAREARAAGLGDSDEDRTAGSRGR